MQSHHFFKVKLSQEDAEKFLHGANQRAERVVVACKKKMIKLRKCQKDNDQHDKVLQEFSACMSQCTGKKKYSPVEFQQFDKFETNDKHSYTNHVFEHKLPS